MITANSQNLTLTNYLIFAVFCCIRFVAANFILLKLPLAPASSKCNKIQLSV